jgi:hypothetical protein
MTISSIGAHRVPPDQPGSRRPSPSPGTGSPTGPEGTPRPAHRPGDHGIRPLLSGEELRFFEGLYPDATAVIRTYGPPGSPETAAPEVGRLIDRKG